MFSSHLNLRTKCQNPDQGCAGPVGRWDWPPSVVHVNCSWDLRAKFWRFFRAWPTGIQHWCSGIRTSWRWKWSSSGGRIVSNSRAAKIEHKDQIWMHHYIICRLRYEHKAQIWTHAKVSCYHKFTMQLFNFHLDDDAKTQLPEPAKKRQRQK